jgi:hypothetical protein
MISFSFGREPGSSALDESVSENDTFANATHKSKTLTAQTQDMDETATSLRRRTPVRKRLPKNIPPFTVISAPHAGRD